ncbi:hypothetical protein N8342_04360 [Acidimicrobiales bacterium]|nr:hypothetical protein [Acidimicrobiales bacterium]
MPGRETGAGVAVASGTIAAVGSGAMKFTAAIAVALWAAVAFNVFSLSAVVSADEATAMIVLTMAALRAFVDDVDGTPG